MGHTGKLNRTMVKNSKNYDKEIQSKERKEKE